MNAYKEKQFLVFELDNNKMVKYDLSQNCFIGKSGKVVKSISADLTGYTIQDIIESFSDEKYRDFLKFLNEEFINKKMKATYSWSTGYSYVGTRVKNIGTFLSRISAFSFFEQYFSAGITNIDPLFSVKISDLPKGYLNYCRNNNIKISEKSLEEYKYNIDSYNLIDSLLKENRYNSLCEVDLRNLLTTELIKEYNREEQRYIWKPRGNGYYYNRSTFYYFTHLCENYNYNKMRLLSYIDDLLTYEGISSLHDLLREIDDYNNMLSEMSPFRKYEKYPKYFLSMHTITARNYNRLIKASYPVEDFTERVNKELEFKFNDYVFIYPESPEAIKDEAVQQNNCVASYIQKVIDGKCDIMFLRHKDDLEKSLVTLEIRDWKVVQSKAKFNQEPTEEQFEVIEEFNKYLQKLKKKQFKNLKEEEKELYNKALNNINAMSQRMKKKVS